MSMIRLHIVAEGQTEENFVNDALVQYLALHDVMADVHCITTSRDKRRSKNFRGGHISYAHLRKDLELWWKEEQRNNDCWLTTMVDLYKFPTLESPYTLEIRAISDPYSRVQQLQQAIEQDISSFCCRFIPYVQLHEFEALTLCNARDLSVFFDNERAVSELRSFVQRFKSPEQINEGEETSPSKRIIAKIPEYDFMKTTAGSEVAAANGIEYLLERCPHFADWIAKLVDLPNLEWKSQ